MSDKNHNFGSFVCIYAQLLPRIKEVAKKRGYALAIHGSMQRDFDIIAVPWVEDASKPSELVEAIANEVDGFVIGDLSDKGIIDQLDSPTKQPHGRLSWNICWGGNVFIDLSVMQPKGKSCHSSCPCPACFDIRQSHLRIAALEAKKGE